MERQISSSSSRALGSPAKYEKLDSPLTPTLSPRKRVEREMWNFPKEKPTNSNLESQNSEFIKTDYFIAAFFCSFPNSAWEGPLILFSVFGRKI
jgi:hypothetical protein